MINFANCNVRQASTVHIGDIVDHHGHYAIVCKRESFRLPGEKRHIVFEVLLNNGSFLQFGVYAAYGFYVPK